MVMKMDVMNNNVTAEKGFAIQEWLGVWQGRWVLP
jgi:hypothetical protein